MTIQTVVCWHGRSNAELIRAKLDDLISIKVTDGNAEIQGACVIRKWTTTEAAQNWIDFLNSLDSPPVSTNLKVS
jgi:hypothetical protein